MPNIRRSFEQKNGKYFDYSLLFVIVFLLGFGLVMLYSVSSYEAMSKMGNSAYYLIHQLRAVMIGLILMLFCSFIPYRFWEKIHRLVYWLCLIPCVAVIFVGTSANNSQRWLSIGGMQFQPSELAKVAVIIYLAAILSRIPKQINKFSTVIGMFLRISPFLIVIAISNLSTAIIIAGIAFVMMFVVSKKYSHFAFILVLGIVAAAAFTLLESYRSVRFAAWLNPEQHPDDAYQTLQGLYALGSGGLFGKGLGGSLQKMNYVPEAQNDFIFSIIVEELGFFGAIGVLLLFALMFWRLMVIAMNAKDLFGSLLVFGVLAHISLQVILNIAVVTNTIPNTGITLPFISYGGTSVMILLVEMGIVLNVSRSIPLRLTSRTEEPQSGIRTRV